MADVKVKCIDASMREALLELSRCDGSSENVANADILARRVRQIATNALAAQPLAAPVEREGWLHLKAKRVLSVDRGHTTVLYDRDIPTELLVLVDASDAPFYGAPAQGEQVPSAAQIEAAWRAFQNCPIDLVGDSDEEQKKCVTAAIKAALAAVPDFAGTSAGVVVRRLNNLISTHDSDITWEKEAAHEMAQAIQLIERIHSHSDKRGARP